MRNILRHLKDMATAAKKLAIYMSYLIVRNRSTLIRGIVDARLLQGKFGDRYKL